MKATKVYLCVGLSLPPHIDVGVWGQHPAPAPAPPSCFSTKLLSWFLLQRYLKTRAHNKGLLAGCSSPVSSKLPARPALVLPRKMATQPAPSRWDTATQVTRTTFGCLMAGFKRGVIVREGQGWSPGQGVGDKDQGREGIGWQLGRKTTQQQQLEHTESHGGESCFYFYYYGSKLPILHCGDCNPKGLLVYSTCCSVVICGIISDAARR